MILVLLVVTLVSCDPVLTALFTPPLPELGRYEVCTTTDSLDNVAAGAGPSFGRSEVVEPLDATLTRLLPGAMMIRWTLE